MKTPRGNQKKYRIVKPKQNYFTQLGFSITEEPTGQTFQFSKTIINQTKPIKSVINLQELPLVLLQHIFNYLDEKSANKLFRTSNNMAELLINFKIVKLDIYFYIHKTPSLQHAFNEIIEPSYDKRGDSHPIVNNINTIKLYSNCGLDPIISLEKFKQLYSDRNFVVSVFVTIKPKQDQLLFEKEYSVFNKGRGVAFHQSGNSCELQNGQLFLTYKMKTNKYLVNENTRRYNFLFFKTMAEENNIDECLSKLLPEFKSP